MRGRATNESGSQDLVAHMLDNHLNFRGIMEKLICWVVFLLFVSVVSVTAADSEQADNLFQYSTINGLLNGFYDGDLTFATLSANGDLGLGTFNHLDGEMVALDGMFYQVKMDGSAYPVDMAEKTPFAVVTHFDVDQGAVLPGDLEYPALQQELTRLTSNRNHFYAFRIQGRFARLTVRSVPAQSPPYRPLAEVVKEQAMFQYEDVEGTLVGFYTPDYMTGLNVPGYHFHFLNKDRTRGGHVLALHTGAGTIEIDEVSEIMMSLPHSQAFASLELARDQGSELEKVEKQ